MKNTETPEEYRARRLDVQQRTHTQHGPSLQAVLASLLPGETPLEPGALMPTPDASLGVRGAGMNPAARRAAGHTLGLGDALISLLPTPTGQDGKNQHAPSAQERHTLALHALAPQIDELEPPGEQMALPFDIDWGPYEPAVRRWEKHTRPAPEPHEPGTRGNQRLSARFVEWMMGLPDGWVTDVPGISDSAQKTALGNGVVPQQAAAAIAILLWALGQ